MNVSLNKSSNKADKIKDAVICDVLAYDNGKLIDEYTVIEFDADHPSQYALDTMHLSAIANHIMDQLYKNGTLAEKGFVAVRTEQKDDNHVYTYVYFCIRVADLPEEYQYQIANLSKFMYHDFCGCNFSGCVSLCHPIMENYRDLYTKQGKYVGVDETWETCIVQCLDDEQLPLIEETRREKGAFVAGVQSIELYLQDKPHFAIQNNTLVKYKSDQTHVTLPDGITAIGPYAFSWNMTLQSITIPDGVTRIEERAFQQCLNLTEIQIPDTVTFIGEHAFGDCENLTELVLPANLTTIEDHAFALCKKLTHVRIPDHVTTIGDNAFSGCAQLTDIDIPDSVTDIGANAFAYTPWLSAQKQNNPLVIINHVLVDASDCSGNVDIPDSVTTIGDFAFSQCNGIVSVRIPDSVTRIGFQAFARCRNLLSVHMSDNVASIGDSAFWSCKSLQNITLSSKLTAISNHLFSECTSLRQITLPDSIASIGNNAFGHCDSLTSVSMPVSLTDIDERTFICCPNLVITRR